METIDKKVEKSLLNHQDLALAVYSLAQLHNAYLASYETEEYAEEMTKEQMEHSIESIQMSHAKFSAILTSLQKDIQEEAAEQEEGE